MGVRESLRCCCAAKLNWRGGGGRKESQFFRACNEGREDVLWICQESFALKKRCPFRF